MRPPHFSATVAIDRLDVTAYRLPTDQPESDGTREWDSTTIVVVEPVAGSVRGLGYGYGDAAMARYIHDVLADIVRGSDVMNVSKTWVAMNRVIRETGRAGVAAAAVSAVDIALWDLKARVLDLPLVTLLGGVHESVPVYGSGGFTSYTIDQLRRQVDGWLEQGIRHVKMKVGRDPEQDIGRVAAAREALGEARHLMVDANGAYTRAQALKCAQAFAVYGVTWIEEPVSSDDLDGLRLVRTHVPPGMEVAAGEYGFDLFYFSRMLNAGAVDVLQPDARRCGGFTGFMRAAALCEAHSLPLSAHTAPSLHVHVCCALPSVRHVEYFHDHVRIENMLFDGVLQPHEGTLHPDLSRPGLGLELKRLDAERYRVFS